MEENVNTYTEENTVFPFNKYLMSTYYVPGIVLGARETKRIRNNREKQLGSGEVGVEHSSEWWGWGQRRLVKD